MQVHQESLPDVVRYLENNKHETLESKQPAYDQYLRLIRRFQPSFGPQSRILEIGTGTGWFPLLCAKNGLQCKGLDISPQLVQHANELGERLGLKPDIEVGNLEDTDIGENAWDVVVVMSVFEHIELWEKGLERIYRSLKPGGILLFESSNKFSLKAVEYDFPLYGWMPDSMRYAFRIRKQGPDIMKLGIDFHQFTYPGLRRHFKKLGFRKIYDRIDIADPSRMSGGRASLTKLFKAVRPIGVFALTFVETTNFVCEK